jgi:hypothetical protein
MAVGGDQARSSGRIPFWVHQIVELLLGVLLLIEGARTGEHPAVLATLGGLLLVLVLCSDGALGAWPWIGRRLHRVLDVLVAALLALSPVVLGLDRVLAIVILESAAAGMLWLALRTEWRTRAARRAAQRPPPDDAAAPAPPPVAPRPAAPTSRPTPRAAPDLPLARKLGTAVGKARDDGPRNLGRLVGRAQRAAKAAMAPDGPQEQSSEPAKPVDAPDAPDGTSGPPADPSPS